MDRKCDVCRMPYTAKRPSSRYCTERCRKRAQRMPKAAAAQLAQVADIQLGDVLGVGSLTVATLKELTAAGRVDTSMGQAALLMARRLDSRGMDTGSAIAALVREHRSTLEDAIKNATRASDPLDQLAEKRADRRAVG